MKSYLLLATSGIAVLLSAASAFCTDYSKYTTEELSKMRGTLYNASSEEKEAFRTEWQKRLMEMTPDQRRSFAGPPSNALATKNSFGRRHGHRRANGLGACSKR